MQRLKICRICLSTNTEQHIVDTELQAIYEKLSELPFQTSDMRPVALCYICRAQLDTTRRLMLKCLKAEELLTVMLNQLLLKSSAAPKLTMIDRSALNDLIITEIQQISIDTDEYIIDDYKEQMQNFKDETFEEHIIQETANRESGVNNEPSQPEPGDNIPLNNTNCVERIQKEELNIHWSDQSELKQDFQETANSESAVCNESRQAQPGDDTPLNNTNNLEVIKQEEANNTSSDQSEVEQEPLIDEKLDIVFEENPLKIVTQNVNTDFYTDTKDRRKLRAPKPKPTRQIYTCDICQKTFNRRFVFKRHTRTHNGIYPFFCKDCNKGFLYSMQLKNHLRTKAHTNDRPFVCEVCNRGFNQITNLQRHKLVHVEIEHHVCNICNKTFNRLSTLKTHPCTQPGDKSYVCKVCQKGFRYRSRLWKHSLIHTRAKRANKSGPGVMANNYVCEVCGKSFTSKMYFTVHSRTHTDEKPHVCDVCGKGFKQKCTLQTHAQIHSGVKPYVCDVCGKSFVGKFALKAHARYHTGVKPFVCNICQRCFYRKDNLIAHTRIHTGEKPYVCDYCDRGFIQRNDLIKHIRTHTGEKPYACNVCKKRFIQKRALTTHARTHTSER